MISSCSLLCLSLCLFSAAIDTAVFSVSSMFHPKETALDIFGDKETSDSRRRCKPAEDDEEGTLLFDIHLRMAVIYAAVYTAIQAMPYCREQLEALMEERGHSISLVLEDAPSMDTPWGLAKAYVDEVNAYLTENDGWNADGSMNRDFNRVPFSDFSKTDSAGNSWTPYKPRNSPYEVSHCTQIEYVGKILQTTIDGVLATAFQVVSVEMCLVHTCTTS